MMNCSTCDEKMTCSDRNLLHVTRKPTRNGGN